MAVHCGYRGGAAGVQETARAQRLLSRKEEMMTSRILSTSMRALLCSTLPAVFFLLLPSLVWAGASPPIVVTNLDDDGAGSLRDGISISAAGGTITFEVTGTISLTTGELVVNKDLTIQGPGADTLQIARDGGAQTPFRIFKITSGNTVEISGVTIRDGRPGFD